MCVSNFSQNLYNIELLKECLARSIEHSGASYILSQAFRAFGATQVVQHSKQWTQKNLYFLGGRPLKVYTIHKNID